MFIRRCLATYLVLYLDKLARLLAFINQSWPTKRPAALKDTALRAYAYQIKYRILPNKLQCIMYRRSWLRRPYKQTNRLSLQDKKRARGEKGLDCLDPYLRPS
ncbi:hypothetical protein GGS26DRAFT_562786 [Hypomontagnella submonticulosa]|nr:hypothetical protein GGS26DRAFT_562786 [Hypomontagnella submonticulosa]